MLLSCLEEWQDIWNSASNNKLCAIYPVGTSCGNNPTSRCEAVIINGLKIGHSRLTHSYLLSGEDLPTCASGDPPLTVKHMLLDCPDLQVIQQKYFTASSLKDIFESIDIKSSFVLSKMLIFTVNWSICYPCFIVVI